MALKSDHYTKNLPLIPHRAPSTQFPSPSVASGQLSVLFLWFFGVFFWFGLVLGLFFCCCCCLVGFFCCCCFVFGVVFFFFLLTLPQFLELFPWSFLTFFILLWGLLQHELLTKPFLLVRSCGLMLQPLQPLLLNYLIHHERMQNAVNGSFL